MDVKGQLRRAQLENVAADYAAATAEGLNWWNTTDKEVRYDDGVKVHTVVSKDKETPLALLNAQAASDVTGLLLSSITHHRVVLEFAIRRRDDSAEQDCAGRATFIYKKDAASWDVQVEYAGDAEIGQPCGVTLTITGAGQVQYATVDFNGGVGANYAGELRWDILKRYANFSS